MGSHTGSAVTSETRVLDANTAGGEWRVVRPRETEVEYDVTHRGDHLFIALRDKDAPNSRLVVAPLADPSRTTASLPRTPPCTLTPPTVYSCANEDVGWTPEAFNSWRACLVSTSLGWAGDLVSTLLGWAGDLLSTSLGWGLVCSIAWLRGRTAAGRQRLECLEGHGCADAAGAQR